MKKRTFGRRNFWKCLTPNMVPYIMVSCISVIEPLVISSDLPNIIGMVIFSAITTALAIATIYTIFKRNMEDYLHNNQATGLSRVALKYTGWLLLSLTVENAIMLLSYK